MAFLSNSSIADWLQFDGANLGPLSCQYVNYTGHLEYFEGEGGGAMIATNPEVVDASCSHVCNDSASLFAPHTNNLVTCGLWSTLLSSYTVYDTDNSLVLNGNDDSIDLFDNFEEVGLNPSLIEYASSYTDIISTCFQLLYYNAKFFTYADDGTTIGACTREQLFPLGSNMNTSIPITSALETCLNAICSPITLNPDLAGIGVISSFIVQSGICILALVALLALEWMAVFGFRKKTVHAALVAGLVDFHKVQCFFASTIQITALILFKEAQRNSALDTTTIRSSYQDFFDTSILVVLATSGLIPISLSLACISRYGRQSWYSLALSLVTMMLSTATLASSYVYAHDYGVPFEVYGSNMNNDWLYNDNKFNTQNSSSTTCNIRGSVGHTVYPLCGSWDLWHNGIGANIFTNYWMWFLWAYCILWLPVCAVKHWSDGRDQYAKPPWWSRSNISAKSAVVGRLAREIGTCRVWTALSCTSWSLCFGCQFYVFSVYFNHSVISTQWSFGQIIAVTVWVPSIVEYIYIEYNGVVEASKYRYPAPLRLTEAAESFLGTFGSQHHLQRIDSDKSTISHGELARVDSDASYMSAYREQGL